MANIKFFRKQSAPLDPIEGYVWFNTDDRTINLYKEGDWEKYGGIIDASYSDDVLTITPAVGDPLVINLDFATTTQFNTLESAVNTHSTAIAAVIAKLEGIQTTVVAAIAEETRNREASDSEFDTRVSTLETTVGKDADGDVGATGLVADVREIQAELDSLNGGAGSIATQIDNAINALNLPSTYDAKGTAATLDAAMDARVTVLEAIDHNQLAADASAAAVATILDNAPESFDTLKEVADWISNNDHASDVATLITDVENLKKIDHEAYKSVIEENELVIASALNELNTRIDNVSSKPVITSVNADEASYLYTSVNNGVVTLGLTLGYIDEEEG